MGHFVFCSWDISCSFQRTFYSLFSAILHSTVATTTPSTKTPPSAPASIILHRKRGSENGAVRLNYLGTMRQRQACLLLSPLSSSPPPTASSSLYQTQHRHRSTYSSPTYVVAARLRPILVPSSLLWPHRRFTPTAASTVTASINGISVATASDTFGPTATAIEDNSVATIPTMNKLPTCWQIVLWRECHKGSDDISYWHCMECYFKENDCPAYYHKMWLYKW